jgi:signal transduction histidine kinase
MERLDSDDVQLIDRIETSAERMQLLVDDLLDFSHVNERPREIESIDLNQKIKKVLVDLELPIEEKKAVIEVGPLPIINGNRRQIQQLFYNLISNSLKYSKANVPPEVSIQSRKVTGSEVSQFIKLIESEQNAAFHLIEVRDNGIGFDQGYAEQIFRMFQRLHGKSEYSGTGVGLSIAKKVIENHNGHIWAKSEINHGSTFYILLPLDHGVAQESIF